VRRPVRDTAGVSSFRVSDRLARLTGARELAAGAYLVAPFGQPERVLDVLA